MFGTTKLKLLKIFTVICLCLFLACIVWIIYFPTYSKLSSDLFDKTLLKTYYRQSNFSHSSHSNVSSHQNISQEQYNDKQSAKSLEEFLSDVFYDEQPVTDETTTTTSTTTTTAKPTFIIETPGCKIIKIDKFNKEVKPYYQNYTSKTFNCSTDAPYVATRVLNNQIKITWKNGSEDSVVPHCYYSKITRRSETSIKYQKRKKFCDDSVICNITFSDVIAVRVTCYESEDQNVTLYEESIPMIPDTVDPDEIMDNDVPNVLLLGIDSASRVNFERHCPKTIEFIKQKKFYRLFGYTRLGENTFPNMVPFYTGMFVKELYNESDPDQYFDHWPLVWKEFKSLGHVTMYAEVWPEAGTFNYFKPGFKDSPVDYYLRTWSLSIADDIRNVKDKKGYKMHAYCYGEQKEISAYYKYTEEFIRTMNAKKQKYFSVVFMGRMTHDYLNNMHFVDDPLQQLLTTLFAKKLLKNTIVILFGDHGLRYGNYIWKTETGKMESRLPLIGIYLPPEYIKGRHRNLTINQHRLTSALDIHATLLHIVRQKSPKDLIRGISLFDEVPDTRTCESTEIDPQWCACDHPVYSVSKAISKQLAKFFTITLNTVLSEVRDICHKLEIKKIISINERAVNDSAVNENKIFSIVAMVDPSDGVFEMMAKYSSDNFTISVENASKVNATQFNLIGDIIRLDAYRNQSHCITTKAKLKYFCYCK